MLANPATDERRIVLYNELGHQLRTSQVVVAMGMLDADSATRTILAVRDVGTSELVLYRWRWRAP